MRHWTISKIMAVTAVVAFVAMLTQAEGCGEHVSRISDIQLSRDEGTLAVFRTDGRVNYDGVRRSFSDMWLSRSLMRAKDGSVAKLLDSRPTKGESGELRAGYCASFFSFSQNCLYFPLDHELVAVDFEGKRKAKFNLPGGVASVAISNDEKQLVYCEVLTANASLVTLSDKKVLWKKPCGTIGVRFFGCALAMTDEHFAILDNEQLQYGQLSAKGQHSTLKLRMNGPPCALHFAKAGSRIVVAFNEFFDLIDVGTGQPQRVQGRFLGKSPDGGRLVVDFTEGLRIMDLETGNQSPPLVLKGWPDVACVSNDGTRIYVGDNNRINCIDSTIGQQLWSSHGPGHYRPGIGWMIFLGIVGVWGWRRFAKRIAKPSDAGSNEMPQSVEEQQLD